MYAHLARAFVKRGRDRDRPRAHRPRRLHGLVHGHAPPLPGVEARQADRSAGAPRAARVRPALMRIVYYVAASLDGRIAGPDHDLEFLETLLDRGRRPRLRGVPRGHRRARHRREHVRVHDRALVAVRRPSVLARHPPRRPPRHRGRGHAPLLRGRPRADRRARGGRAPAGVAARRRQPRRPVPRGRSPGRADRHGGADVRRPGPVARGRRAAAAPTTASSALARAEDTEGVSLRYERASD